VLKHYESQLLNKPVSRLTQTEDEAILEDEEASKLKDQTLIVVPKKLVPQITRLIQRERSRSSRLLK
jgi:hypothetical protein